MQAPGSIERRNQPRWSTVCWRFSLYGDLATHAFNPTPLADYMQLKAYSLWQLFALLSVSRQRWTSKTLPLLSLSPLRLLLPPPMLPLLTKVQRHLQEGIPPSTSCWRSTVENSAFHRRVRRQRLPRRHSYRYRQQYAAGHYGETRTTITEIASIISWQIAAIRATKIGKCFEFYVR